MGRISREANSSPHSIFWRQPSYFLRLPSHCYPYQTCVRHYSLHIRERIIVISAKNCTLSVYAIASLCFLPTNFFQPLFRCLHICCAIAKVIEYVRLECVHYSITQRLKRQHVILNMHNLKNEGQRYNTFYTVATQSNAHHTTL